MDLKDQSMDLPKKRESSLSCETRHLDLWQDHGKVHVDELLADSHWDWHSLRERIRKHGLRNSLLVAPMPTASTAQILGNTECFEPITSNIYVRRVLAGEFAVFNRHLVRTLEQLGIWNDDVRTSIIAHNGSVQQVDGIPDHFAFLPFFSRYAFENSSRHI